MLQARRVTSAERAFGGNVELETVSKFRPPAPAPREKPLGPIGLFRALARNPLETWTEAHFNEPIVMGGLPFGRVAVINDPAAIRHVLFENTGNYHKDWIQRRVLSAGLSDGLLTAEKEQWRMQRRAIAPLFARRSVMSFSAAMTAAADDLVARIRARPGETIDLAVEVTRVTLDVLERTIFSDGLGRDREDIRTGMQSYFESMGRIDPFDVIGWPDAIPRPGWRKVRGELKLFEGAIDTIIATRRNRLAESADADADDILSLLVSAKDPETGQGLSEKEIRANILTFIAAGHETTSNAIAWSLYLLSQSPHWADRVAAEANREFGGERHTLADRLVETRAVIDEANRLYPPIGAISRAALGPDTLVGHEIGRGTMVVIAQYVLHRHRTLWDDPDVFDPSRFLPGARDKIDRFAYLPFGAGPRICIGATFALQEASVIVATLMRHFRLELAPGHVVWPVQKVTLRPGGGLPMILTAR